MKAKRIKKSLLARIKEMNPFVSRNLMNTKLVEQKKEALYANQNTTEYWKKRALYEREKFGNRADKMEDFNSTFVNEMDTIDGWIQKHFRKLVNKTKNIKEHVSRWYRVQFGMFGIFSNTIDNSLDSVHMQSRASWTRYFLDPIATNTIDQLLFYAIDKGLPITVAEENLDEYLQRILRDYRWLINGKWDFRRANVDGSILYFLEKDDENKTIKIRRLKIEEIVEIIFFKGSPILYSIDPKYFGGDDDEKLWHKSSRFDLDSNGFLIDEIDGEIKTDGVVYWIRYGDSKYGEPYLSSALRWMQIHEEFRKDTARLAHEISRVIFKRKVWNPDEDVDAQILRNAPPGGYQITEVPNQVEYEIMSPKIDGSGFKDIDRILRVGVSTGTRTPEHVSFQDSSNNNYASVLEAKNPYVMFAGHKQDWWVDELRLFLSELIRLGAGYGYVDKTIKAEKFNAESMRRAADFIIERVMLANEEITKDVIDDIKKEAKELLGETKKGEINSWEVIIKISAPILRTEDPLKVAQTMLIYDELNIPLEMIWERMGFKAAEILAARRNAVQKLVDKQKQEDWDWDAGRSQTPPDYLKEKDN